MTLSEGGAPIEFGVHRYLRNSSGGRLEFEQMVAALVDRLEGPAHQVALSPGDGGIDVYVGDLTTRASIWQVKYFIDGVGDAQMRDIHKSFTRVLATAKDKKFTIDRWVLCIPGSLDLAITPRWERWRNRRASQTGITTELWDENRLRSKLLSEEVADIRRAYYGLDSTPRRRAEPRLRIRPADNQIDLAERWRGGATLAIGETEYLLHDPVETETAADRSWRVNNADAQAIEPAAGRVRIRHTQMLRHGPEALARRDGLVAQAELLDKLAGAGGLPRLLDHRAQGEHTTLVHTAPTGRPWRVVFGRLLERTAAPGHFAVAEVTATAARLCATLARLHRLGQAHRLISADTVLIGASPDRLVVPRDLGLAGFGQLRDEGGECPAPEQRFTPLESAPNGHPGPASDVYQVAALVLDTLGLPIAQGPVVRGAGPPLPPPTATGLPAGRDLLLPPRLEALLGRALDPQPSRRPGVDQLSAALSAARRDLPTGERA